MPLYEYSCPKCGEVVKEFEHKSIAATEHRPKCPKCGTLCDYAWGTPMAITNPAWIGKDGRPINPVQRYLNHQDAEKKISDKDKAAISREKKEWAEKRGR